jgi:hypothetical protein
LPSLSPSPVVTLRSVSTARSTWWPTISTISSRPWWRD